jgi:CAAX protease family protein
VTAPVRSPLWRTVAAPADDQRGAVLATLGLTTALAGVNVAKHLLPGGDVWFSVAAAGALLAFGRQQGISWAQLGLGRHRLLSGARWAAGVILVVAGAYVVGVLLPLTRQAFLDPRYHQAVPQALSTAFVVIPLGTVLLEEVAFRSVLWGMLSRHTTARWVLLGSSSLFGLWHILPALRFASAHRGLDPGGSHAGAAQTVAVVAGTVAFTALGGLVAGELRRRSGSLLASAGMHWATNALGVLFGVAAWRLAS